MKKHIKIVLFILIVIMMLIATTNVVEAAVQPKEITGSSIINTEKIEGVGSSVATILTTIGMTLSVLVLIVLGIKYMMGSVEEKAQYKKTLIPYIIGAGFVFASTSIATVVFNFSTSAL